MEPSGSAMFAPENRAHMESSFRAFLARPENRPLVEEQQRLEVAGALALQEQEREARLREQVLALPPEDQRRLKPVLQHSVLRRLLQSLTNSGRDDGTAAPGSSNSGGPTPLAEWVENPRVMVMLSQAARALRKGELSEQELEQLLLGQLRGRDGKLRPEAATPAGSDGGSEAAGEWGVASGGAGGEGQLDAVLPNRVVLPSHLLVEALNEHLAERRAGGAAYRAGDAPRALEHYRRAVAVVEFVRGASREEQAEVARCLARALWCDSAARMALEEWGAAIAACSRALAALRSGGGGGAVDAGHQLQQRAAAESLDAELEARVLLRRAKAHLARHEHSAALADLAAAEALDPWANGLPELRDRARDMEAREARGGGSGEDAALARRMLRGLSMSGGTGSDGASGC